VPRRGARWVAIRGEVSSDALLLFLIIFAWTPPHFWALALYREKRIRQRRHPDAAGDARRRIHPAAYLLYTIVLVAATLMPFATHMSGGLYLAGALMPMPGSSCTPAFVSSLFRYAGAQTFRYSIQYLAFLFAYC